jgi:SAM-dependent methyltransferase
MDTLERVPVPEHSETVCSLCLEGTGVDVPDLAEAYAVQARRIRTEHWSGPPEMVERIAALARTRAEDLVIDVGCGVGGPAKRLAGLVGCRVIGVDVVEQLVVAASVGAPTRVRFVAGNALRLPIRSSSAHQVWALGVPAHVPDHDAMAAEIHRVLVPGGMVAVTEAFRAGHRMPRFASSAPQPWRAITVGAFMAALLDAGLEDARVHPWPGTGIPGSLDAENPALARDLREGALVPRLVMARRP